MKYMFEYVLVIENRKLICFDSLFVRSLNKSKEMKFSDLEVVSAPFHINSFNDYNADPSLEKKNYLYGAYKGPDGRPFVFPVVKKVEQELLKKVLFM